MIRQASLQQTSIQYVKGVGPSRAERLARLGIRSVEDLLWHAPRRYEDRTQFASIRNVAPGQLVTIQGRVLAKSLRRLRGGRTLVEAAFGDATGVLLCRWFNQPYLARQLAVDQELIVHGRVEPGPRLELIHPEMERVELSSDDAAIHMGRIVPIYPLTEGVGQRWLRRLVHAVLERYAGAIEEVLPTTLRRRRAFPQAVQAIRQLHFPDTWESLEQARHRLAYEECLLLQVRLALRRARLRTRRKPQQYHPNGSWQQTLLDRLPFRLTASQRDVLVELMRDLRQPAPMLRLLQGDVGCGKTVVAAAVMAAVVESGYQVAVMVPTELLAEQHARVLTDYFKPLGVHVGLLSQAIGASERQRVLEALAKASLQIVVGTHAVLEAAVSFRRLALVVIDEQHKFGVGQRSRLIRKAPAADVLVMSATPIPRTLALCLYGDVACSTITELPPGRRPVRTVWRPESARGEAYRAIEAELRRGRQGYIVYPLVEPSDRYTLKAATHMAQELEAGAFAAYRVALLHGQMRPKDKERIMRAFLEGRIQLLISTVIVEVGLDVPNATIMLIEHPERFGLAQLHQLRGRIGRGTDQATCLLVTDAVEEEARARLEAFVETTDGFRLAEKDLELRGPGQLLGKDQHGWLRFRIAELPRDHTLLEMARQDALELVAQDPTLGGVELAGLKKRLGGASQSRE